MPSATDRRNQSDPGYRITVRGADPAWPRFGHRDPAAISDPVEAVSPGSIAGVQNSASRFGPPGSEMLLDSVQPGAPDSAHPGDGMPAQPGQQRLGPPGSGNLGPAGSGEYRSEKAQPGSVMPAGRPSHARLGPGCPFMFFSLSPAYLLLSLPSNCTNKQPTLGYRGYIPDIWGSVFTVWIWPGDGPESPVTPESPAKKTRSL